jgi:hypothetical protein
MDIDLISLGQIKKLAEDNGVTFEFVIKKDKFDMQLRVKLSDKSEKKKRYTFTTEEELTKLTMFKLMSMIYELKNFNF